jgi:hypothetical protein
VKLKNKISTTLTYQITEDPTPEAMDGYGTLTVKDFYQYRTTSQQYKRIDIVNQPAIKTWNRGVVQKKIERI